MKISRFIFWLYLIPAFCPRGFCQKTVNLEIIVQDSSKETGAEMLRRLHLASPLRLKFSGLDPKMEQIVGYFENSGYPFVRATFDSVSPVPEGISGILRINPGGLVIFDTLMNRTGFRISAPVLYRLVNIHPGDRYSESAVREASSRLEQVPYLKLSRPPEIGFHPGKASVYLYPEKKGANRFDGWVGLSPDLRAGGKVAFSGALSLDLYNILSQGESWRFNWHRTQDASQQLNLAAHLPYMAGLPIGLQGKFELYRQDTSYLNLSWDAGIPYHFSPLNLVNVFVRHRESNVIVPSSDVKTSNRQPFTSFLSGLAWEYNRLDNMINPYRGVLVKIEASTGRKSIPDSLSVNQSEFLADISWFQPISRNLTCALILQSAMRKSPESFENEQYRVGGLNLMRGFDENVFYADAYAVTSIELRYLLDRSSHLIALADFGFLRTTDKGSTVIKTPAGFGLGGQIRTGSGIFRIIFALGKESRQPLNLKNSKIHLGYVGVF